MQVSEAADAPTAGGDQGSGGGLEGDGNDGATAASTSRAGSLDRNDAGGAAASGDTAATRLWRATEAARELGLSCAS